MQDEALRQLCKEDAGAVMIVGSRPVPESQSHDVQSLVALGAHVLF